MPDRAAIEQLFADYAWPLDTMEWDGFADNFTADARFTVSIAGEQVVGPLEGRDTIAEFVKGTASEQTDVRRHVVSNIRIIGESGNTADVTAILTLVVVDDGRLDVKSSGIYQAQVRQGDDGKARFCRMHIALDLAF